MKDASKHAALQVNFYHEYQVNEFDWTWGKFILTVLVAIGLIISGCVYFSEHFDDKVTKVIKDDCSNPNFKAQTFFNEYYSKNTPLSCTCKTSNFPFSAITQINPVSCAPYYDANNILNYYLCEGLYQSLAGLLNQSIFSPTLINSATVQAQLTTQLQQQLYQLPNMLYVSTIVSSAYLSSELVELVNFQILNQTQMEIITNITNELFPFDYNIVPDIINSTLNTVTVNQLQYLTMCCPENCIQTVSNTLGNFGNTLSFVGGLFPVAVLVTGLIYNIFWYVTSKLSNPGKVVQRLRHNNIELNENPKEASI